MYCGAGEHVSLGCEIAAGRAYAITVPRRLMPAVLSLTYGTHGHRGVGLPLPIR